MGKKKVNNKKTVEKKNTIKPVEQKEEKVVEKEKRYLIIGLLYLVCGFLWFIGGATKMAVKESYLIDIILGVVLLILSCFYFIRYRKGNK